MGDGRKRKSGEESAREFGTEETMTPKRGVEFGGDSRWGGYPHLIIEASC